MAELTKKMQLHETQKHLFLGFVQSMEMEKHKQVHPSTSAIYNLSELFTFLVNKEWAYVQ
jgi:hypothetical protein